MVFSHQILRDIPFPQMKNPLTNILSYITIEYPSMSIGLVIVAFKYTFQSVSQFGKKLHKKGLPKLKCFFKQISYVSPLGGIRFLLRLRTQKFIL